MQDRGKAEEDMTKEEFIESYAKKSGVSVDFLQQENQRAVPC